MIRSFLSEGLSPPFWPAEAICGGRLRSTREAVVTGAFESRESSQQSENLRRSMG